MVAWALRELNIVPSHEWLDAFAAGSAEIRRLSSWTSAEITTILSSFAYWHKKTQIMDQGAGPSLNGPSLNDSHAASSNHSHASFQGQVSFDKGSSWRPSMRWMSRFWWQSGRLLVSRSIPPKHLAPLLAAMIDLDLVPHSTW